MSIEADPHRFASVATALDGIEVDSERLLRVVGRSGLDEQVANSGDLDHCDLLSRVDNLLEGITPDRDNYLQGFMGHSGEAVLTVELQLAAKLLILIAGLDTRGRDQALLRIDDPDDQ